MPRPLLSLLTCLSLATTAAQCPTGDVLITSEADLSNYAMLYGSCDTLPGHLIITGAELPDFNAFASLRMIMGDLRLQAIPPGPPDLSGFVQLAHIGGGLSLNSLPPISLNGLGSLQRIDGDLSIAFVGITNLNGLSSLSVVGGDLQVMHAPNMTSLSGLVQLDTVHGNITINEALDNPAFTSIAVPGDLKYVGGDLYLLTDHATTIGGGNALHHIGGNLYISGPALQSVTGFSNLNTIGGDLDFNFLPAFTTINAFTGLSSIQGAFSLTNAPLLTSLSGFPQLQAIGNQLWVTGNTLQSITGFPQLSSIGTLHLTGCPLLNNISAFDHPITLGQIVIEDNPALSICHVQSVCDKLANAFPFSQNITNNASGCTSPQEVLTFCNITTGVPAQPASQHPVSLFPNPATDLLHLRSHQPIQHIRIRDQSGRTILHPPTSQGGIQVRTLPPGAYLLEVQHAEGRHTLMFLKE